MSVDMMNDLTQQWEQNLSADGLGMADLDAGFRQPLTGNETREELNDRVDACDVKRESVRKQRLTNTQDSSGSASCPIWLALNSPRC